MNIHMKSINMSSERKETQRQKLNSLGMEYIVTSKCSAIQTTEYFLGRSKPWSNRTT